VVNGVDLIRPQPQSEHPHGLSDKQIDVLFTRDKPIVFAFHGYPLLIHRLPYRRTSHPNLHVRGFKEEGTTTTPFDMTVMTNWTSFTCWVTRLTTCRNWGRVLPGISRTGPPSFEVPPNVEAKRASLPSRGSLFHSSNSLKSMDHS
jgi:hypothetical protein